jgi:hypothetical protein
MTGLLGWNDLLRRVKGWFVLFFFLFLPAMDPEENRPRAISPEKFLCNPSSCSEKKLAVYLNQFHTYSTRISSDTIQ